MLKKDLVLVYNLYLLTHALAMDKLVDMSYKVGIHTAKCALCTTLLKDFVVASRLKHGHVVLLLVLTDFATYAHTLREEFHELVVEIVYLMTQLRDTFGCYSFATHLKKAEDVVKNIRCNLLLSIAPCAIWVAMALNDKTIEAKVHSLLT